jgi:tellurite methyltransferase
VPSDRERWDDRHRAALADGAGARSPADVLGDHAALLGQRPAGPALDVACGLGRNALHLARLGLQVHAVDASPVAVDHVRRAAAAEGLAVRATVRDLASEGVPGGGYAVVVVTFFLRRPLLGALEAALAPGGLLLYETFLADDAAAYGPHDPDRVLQPGELRSAFGALELLAYREGARAPGERATAALAARRRAG